MRVIHHSAECGRWEAIVFTLDKADPKDLMGPGDIGRPGFSVDLDKEIRAPAEFYPSFDDVYVKQGL